MGKWGAEWNVGKLEKAGCEENCLEASRSSGQPRQVERSHLRGPAHQSIKGETQAPGGHSICFMKDTWRN